MTENTTEKEVEFENGLSENPTSETSHKSSEIKIVLLICLTVFIMVVIGIVYYKLPFWCVKESVTIEAGTEIPAISVFLEWEEKNASIISGINENIDTNHVQDVNVVLNLYYQNRATILHIQDTITPEMKTKDMSIMFGDPFEVEDFVENISDNTDCVVNFLEEPKIEGGGMYTITIIAEDEGGNICQEDAMLEVIEDTTPPVIEGVKEITMTVGENVSYKKDIVVTDDYDEKVALEIDNSQVDTDVSGEYAVIYSATDSAGNKTEISTSLYVREVNVNPVASSDTPMTAEAVNAEADKILASITNSSMSQYEVIKAIYDWCHTKIAYVDGAPKDDWVAGAYYGLIKRAGDCYTYAMTAKCLLTRAGITNMDIVRIPVGNGMHFWNLVDIGEGWHHFDTCRRADGAMFFYLTEAELMAYSNQHTGTDYPDGTHHYDRSLYPEIP
ncbi:MAG: transglutaminase domain-containing protein [Eubacteriales bacterium]